MGHLVLKDVKFNTNGDAVVGSSDGNLMIYKGSTFSKSIEKKKKNSAVEIITIDKKRIYSGAKDGLIIVWSLDYQIKFKVAIDAID